MWPGVDSRMRPSGPRRRATARDIAVAAALLFFIVLALPIATSMVKVRRPAVWLVAAGLLVVMYLVVLGWPDTKRRWRVVRGCCPDCGYSLAGLAPGSACPECGKAVTRDDA